VLYCGQLLAVKQFKDDSPDARRRDLGSLTSLSHSNIARIHYIMYENNNDRDNALHPSGYAMELMAQSAGSGIECSLDQLLDLFVQIADALSYCHSRGVVHFDVKPDNILLNDALTIAKLCDFGHAHKLQSIAEKAAASSLGMQRGTLDYMAPEMYYGTADDNDSKLCDVYSFGKTMWRLLHPSEEITPVSSCVVSAAVPTALKVLLEQCTLRSPTDRPQSMSQILSALQDISADYQNAPVSVAETDTLPMPPDSLLTACFQRFNQKHCADVKLELKSLWCQWKLWVFLLFVFLLFLGSAKEVLTEGLYLPLHVPCPALNASEMPSHYSMVPNSGQNMSIAIYDGIIIEPRITTNVLQVLTPKSSNPSPGVYSRNIVVILWVNNRLAAVFKQNEDRIYDCHGNAVYKTCYDCGSNLKIYSMNDDYRWSSSLPLTDSSANDDTDIGATTQVFGQPYDVPVALISKNRIFNVLNSTHPASDPILLIAIFARAYFETRYDSSWERFNAVCLIILFFFFLLVLCISTIKLIHAGLSELVLKSILCCLQMINRHSNPSLRNDYFVQMEDL